MKLAEVIDVSDPLTIKEILEWVWVVGGEGLSGERMFLRDTRPYGFPYKEWRKGDALVLMQAFYPEPIDWATQKWVVLMLKWVDEGEPVQTMRFPHWYSKLDWSVFTTIRKAGSRSARLKVGDVVEVDVKASEVVRVWGRK